ncbi:MAG: metallophosphoesterase [Xanthomonadales bacterium]|nr:metallophosphoesterase [Xanthomonadales bacterium]
MTAMQTRTGLAGTLLVLLTTLAACGTPHYTIDADVPHSGGRFPSGADAFQFAIVGDRTGGHRPGVFEHAVEQINLLQPEFVVGVGDLIEGYSDDRQKLEREWQEFDAIVQRLDMPFFYTVGNHDIGNQLSHELWRERYGRDYYAFKYRDVLFLSLNTEDPPVILPPEALAGQARLEAMMREDPAGVMEMLRKRRAETGAATAPPRLPGSVAISSAQVDWVAATLARHADARWTIVLMHKPAWDYNSAAFARIEELLADRPYTVIAGHEHYYNYTRRQDRDYITMATTGGIWLSEEGGAFDHIAWVTMTGNGPLITNIALCGLLGTPEQTQELITSEQADRFCLRPAAMP